MHQLRRKGGDAMSGYYDLITILIRIAQLVVQIVGLNKKDQPPSGK